MGYGEADPDREFELWYHSEHPRVLAALVVAGGDVETAREATDEAFVRAYQKWSRVREMASPGGWLYRVALNELRRRFRRRTIEHELFRHGRMRSGHSSLTHRLRILGCGRRSGLCRIVNARRSPCDTCSI